MELTIPSWSSTWLGDVVATQHADRGACSATLETGSRYRRVTCRVPEAAHFNDDDLQAASRDAYLLVRELLEDHQPVRLWNGLPGILDNASRQRDRYMVFNAGRHAAFNTWWGGQGPEAFAAAMPAGTGVGHPSDTLTIHALADTRAGIAVENPRQCPAFLYSKRYGPLPPCFSRGTVVDAPEGSVGKCLLISGTASVVGEDSAHVGDVDAQLDETFDNIAALIEAAGGKGLESLCDLRIYYTPTVDRQHLEQQLAARLSSWSAAAVLEFTPVLLCRSDLLVEIEGLALL